MSRVKKIVGSKMFTFVRVILSIVYRSTGTKMFLGVECRSICSVIEIYVYQ